MEISKTLRKEVLASLSEGAVPLKEVLGGLPEELKGVDLLVGPEGDFSIKERENILKLKNIIPIKISNNILRSETAAISMISIISFNLLS